MSVNPLAASLPATPQGVQPQGTQTGLLPTVQPLSADGLPQGYVGQPQLQQQVVNTSQSVTGQEAMPDTTFSYGDLRLHGLPAEVVQALQQAVGQGQEHAARAYAQQHVSRLQSVYDQRLAALEQQNQQLQEQVFQQQLDGLSEDERAYYMTQREYQALQSEREAFYQQQQQFTQQQRLEQELQSIASEHQLPVETVRQVAQQRGLRGAVTFAAQQSAARQLMPQVPSHQLNYAPPTTPAAASTQRIPAWDSPEFAQLWEGLKNGGVVYR